MWPALFVKCAVKAVVLYYWSASLYSFLYSDRYWRAILLSIYVISFPPSCSTFFLICDVVFLCIHIWFITECVLRPEGTARLRGQVLRWPRLTWCSTVLDIIIQSPVEQRLTQSCIFRPSLPWKTFLNSATVLSVLESSNFCEPPPKYWTFSV